MRKMISMIIILLFIAQAAYAGDEECLRVPINKDQDRLYISMLTKKAKSGVDILEVIRPSTRKVFDILIESQRKNKKEISQSLLARHVIKFDSTLFYELYIICKLYDWDGHRKLKYLAAERPDFVLQMVIHAAVLEKIGLSSEEMLVLDQYISVPNDKDNEIVDLKLSAKVLQVILGKGPKRDYDVLSRYFEALSAMASEVNKYDIFTKDDIDDVFFTRTEKSGYGLLDTYIAAREPMDDGNSRSILAQNKVLGAGLVSRLKAVKPSHVVKTSN